MYENAALSSEDAVEVPPPPPPPVPAAASAEPSITLDNSLVVKVSLLAALAGFLVSNLAGVLPSAPLKMMGLIGSLAGAGFLAVLLYMRRSGQSMTVLAGARLGWITGVFLFVVFLVLLTISLLAPPEQFAEMMRQSGSSADDVRAVTNVLRDPEQMSVLIVISLLVLFTTCSMMASIGGALGAKWLEGRKPAA